MKKYPFMGSFVIRAFYETDPLIQSEIEKSYAELISLKAVPACSNLGSKQLLREQNLREFCVKCILFQRGIYGRSRKKESRI